MRKAEKKESETGGTEKEVSGYTYEFYLRSDLSGTVGYCQDYTIHFNAYGDPFEVTFYNAVIDGKKYEIFKANYGEVKWIKKL